MVDEARELSRIFNKTIAARRIGDTNYPFLIYGAKYSARKCINPFKDLIFTGYLVNPGSGFKYKEYLGKSLDLNPNICGARNYKKGVVYSFIRPIKQYRWGWNIPSDSAEHTPHGVEIPLLAGKSLLTEGSEFLFSLINPQYPSAQEAYSLIENGEAKAVAFDEKWFIYSIPNKTYFLSYRNKTVGVVRNGVAHLPQKVSFLTEELSQFMEVGYELSRC